MIVEELQAAHIVLAALYLRGAPRPCEAPRRGWRTVLRTMRETCASVERAAEALRGAGLWVEAGIVEAPKLLSWAEERSGTVLTPVRAGYPGGWLRAFGDAAPPAVWVRGEPSSLSYVGAVGSRVVLTDVAEFAIEVGARAVREGYALVSGGAEGCDTFAARGAKLAGGEVTRILPCGLGAVAPLGLCDLTACAPDEPFSTAAAMERNALIYAAAEATVVSHARFRTGGTWHGATDALRRRLGRLIVREEPESQAHRTLIALGAIPLPSPSELREAMARAPMQAALFSAA